MIYKIARAAGAVTAIVVVGYVFFDTYSAAQEAKSTKEIVDQLQEIHIKENTAEQAEIELTRKLCIAKKLKDIDDCAEVGIEIDE